jgi:flagellar hook assembly protein FlgD
VALERINYNYTTQDKTNWTSAASTAGFGTPGYPNSQLRADRQVQGQVTIFPAVFSPDNDGRDDFATIQYELPEPGYVTNISIFDAHGYRVRYLVQQATLSLTGQFRWDGLDDKLNRLPVGTYIVLTELFHLNGKTKKYKSVVTLVRR